MALEENLMQLQMLRWRGWLEKEVGHFAGYPGIRPGPNIATSGTTNRWITSVRRTAISGELRRFGRDDRRSNTEGWGCGVSSARRCGRLPRDARAVRLAVKAAEVHRDL